MKTYKNLYPEIYSFYNLYWAWKKARRGKRYGAAAAEFERDLDLQLVDLQAELIDETYQPGPYTHFTVHEPKRRKISAAPFRDRVVHHALCNLLIPIYERKFIHDTYANRVGKGTHAALDCCTYFMRRYPYVLQCDIQQFFPAIDHAILKTTLGRVIADAQTMRLCEKIIDSGVGVLDDAYTMRYFEGDDLLAVNRPRGLPIGNLTSQFWANVYLNDFDHFVKRDLKCTAYIRYVDDFLLFADKTATLLAWRDRLIDFLNRLRLTLHLNRAHPSAVEHGVPFLGFIVYPNYRRLKRDKGIHYRRRLHSLYRRYRTAAVDRNAIVASIQAWLGHVQHGDTWHLQGKVLSTVVL